MSTNINTHLKNPRVDVRKRNLDYSKPLTIVKTREELKKYESTYHDESKEDEILALTTLMTKKKFEILVPQNQVMQPVADSNIISGNIDAKKGSNEESASTSHSINGDATAKTSPNQLTQPSANGVPVAAKPQAKPTAQIMRDSQLEGYLKYKPIFKQPAHYIKYKEPVYEGYENFSFDELNYEVTEKDLKFLESGVVDISVQDFERVIDVFEKIVVVDQNQSLAHLQQRFYEKAPKQYCQRIQKQTLELIYQKYWKSEREKRKRSFLRIFWEKADYDDQDTNAAFRKRVKEKMKLRKKAKYEIESYKKMFELREDFVKVLHILKDVYRREEIKKSQNLVEMNVYELQLEQSLKEKGIAFQPRNQKVDLKKLEGSQVEKVMTFQISERKDCHPMFQKYFPEQLAEKLMLEEQTKRSQKESAGYYNQTPQKQNQSHQKAQQQQQQQFESQDQQMVNATADKQSTKTRTGAITIKPPQNYDKNGASASLNQSMSTEQGGQIIIGNNFQDNMINPQDRLPTKKIRDKKNLTTLGQQRGIAEQANIYTNQTIPYPGRQEVPVKEDTLCNLDMVTVITKIIHCSQRFGATYGDKYLKLEQNTPKDIKDKIDNTFLKPPLKSIDEDMDDTMDTDKVSEPVNMINQQPQVSLHSSQYLQQQQLLNSAKKPLNLQQQLPKKNATQLELENELEELLNRKMIVRRGRNNRLLLKMIDIDVFEDKQVEENADISKLSLGKRRKAYGSVLDFINRGVPGVSQTNQNYYLLRDKKFLEKRFKKTQSLLMRENIKSIVKKEIVQRKSLFEESKAQPLHGVNSIMQDSSLSSDILLAGRTNSIISNFVNQSQILNSVPNVEPIMTNNNSINYDLQASAIRDQQQYDNTSEYVVSHILRTNLQELLELAEGVGEFGEYEAHKDSPNQLDDMQKKLETAFRGFKQQRMPMIGGGHHYPSSTNLAQQIGNPASMGSGMSASMGQMNQNPYAQPQLQHMPPQQSGRIGMQHMPGSGSVSMNMSSTSGNVNMPNQMPYGSTSMINGPPSQRYMGTGVAPNANQNQDYNNAGPQMQQNGVPNGMPISAYMSGGSQNQQSQQENYHIVAAK